MQHLNITGRTLNLITIEPPIELYYGCFTRGSVRIERVAVFPAPLFAWFAMIFYGTIYGLDCQL